MMNDALMQMKSRLNNTKHRLTGIPHRALFFPTLLRTALLVGALAFVNVPQTQAQNAEQRASLPDAFEAVSPETILGDNDLLSNYYYIQFYIPKGEAQEYFYLADRGEGNPMRTKDFIPFAKNIQWYIEKISDNEFRLRSGDNNYVYFDYTDDVFKCTSNQGNASRLTYREHKDGGYEIQLVSNPEGTANSSNRSMRNNNGGNGWAIINRVNNDNARACLRFAKLKDERVAYIIFYQDPTYTSKGEYVEPNSEIYNNRDWFTQRHYLTYSDTGDNTWTSVITNGDMSGDDVTSFRVGAAATQPATIKEGVGRMGGRGVEVTSIAGQTQIWSTQFFVCANAVIGTQKVHVEFDYKANRAVEGIRAQAQNDPGNWISAP